MSDSAHHSRTAKPSRSGTETRSSRALLVRLPAADHAQLSARADAAGVTVQELMRQAALAAGDTPKQRRQLATRELTLCDGDRIRLSELFRSTSTLAGLLVQSAKSERIAAGQTELWRAFERHLDALAESRLVLREILAKSR